jgi:DNA repair exonuclease SbcCD ATPase subunit
VPVKVIRRDQDDGANANKLDATRQALREQIEAREQAEHRLQEAQATIRDLQTKLAHERLARDEAIQRVVSEMQVVEQALQRVQDELATERGCRQKAEQERDDAVVARQEAEERMRDAMESKETPENSAAPSPVRSARRATHAGPIRVAKNTEPVAGEKAKAGRMVPATDAGTTYVKQALRRGRPPKAEPQEEIVEWWKPGWHERFR